MRISPREWFLVRLDDPVELRVVRNRYGTYDVLLRIDGGLHLEDIPRLVGEYRVELEDVVAQCRRSGEPDAA